MRKQTEEIDHETDSDCGSRSDGSASFRLGPGNLSRRFRTNRRKCDNLLRRTHRLPQRFRTDHRKRHLLRRTHRLPRRFRTNHRNQTLRSVKIRKSFHPNKSIILGKAPEASCFRNESSSGIFFHSFSIPPLPRTELHGIRENSPDDRDFCK